MEDIDQRIRDALSDEDRALFEQGEPGLRDLVLETFRGRLRFFTWVSWIMTLVLFGLQVFSAVRYFGVEALEDKVMWATLFLFFAMGVGMLKIWLFMQMDKAAVLREIKRLELQVARLGGKCPG